MFRKKTQEEWEAGMAEDILEFVRNELYLDLRFLDVALSAFVYKSNALIHAFATDGCYLYYSTEQVWRVFRENAPFLDRAYLHTVLHCIFSHLWIAPPDVDDARMEMLKSEDGESGISTGKLWDLACDIAVEYTIDKMDKPCTRRILSWSRQQIYEKIDDRNEQFSAAVLYRRLKAYTYPEIMKLLHEFYTDDHCYWPGRKQASAKMPGEAQTQEKWNKIAMQTSLERRRRGDETKDGEELFEAQVKAKRSRRSYRDFLQKFSVRREELHCDMDEFDLNSYTYGLRLYQNMPLIEPLESREVKKIRDFVIAVDTSDSTSGELIRSFLRETADILTFHDGFFSDSRIHVIQCDNEVRSDTMLEGTQDMEQFLEQFQVAGGGGTDFRPVFSYVNDLIQKGQFQNLCGLLYFTDGKGIYPKKRPDYKTAFLFLNEFDETLVPPWAIRLKLEPEEFALYGGMRNAKKGDNQKR